MSSLDNSFVSVDNETVIGFNDDYTQWTEEYESVLYIHHLSTFTSISQDAFADDLLKIVYIPDNIEIQQNAFSNCKNLKYAYIGQNCTFYEDSFPDDTVVVVVNYNSFK